MKKYIKYMGLPLVYAGVILLIICYFTGLSNINILLFIGLILIVAGIAGYIYLLKKQSEY